MLRMGKAKLVIIAGNTPPLRKSELSVSFVVPSPKSAKLTVDRLCYALQESCTPLQWQQRTYSTFFVISEAVRMLVGRRLSHIMDRIKAQSIHNEVVYCDGRMLFISTTLWLHSPSPSESNPAKKLCLVKFRRAKLLILSSDRTRNGMR